MSELSVLLEEWQASMKKVDQLRELLDSLRSMDGIEPSTLANVRMLLNESEAKERHLRERVISTPRA